MKPKLIVCAVCLLIAGGGPVSAGSVKVKTDRNGVEETSTVSLLPKKKLRNTGKVVFRCRIRKCGDRTYLLAEILKNDSLVHIVGPGVAFSLENGKSVVLMPERIETCRCSEWADGRWNNAEFELSPTDADDLKNANIVSVSVASSGGTISRKVVSGRQDAVARCLKAIGE